MSPEPPLPDEVIVMVADPGVVLPVTAALPAPTKLKFVTPVARFTLFVWIVADPPPPPPPPLLAIVNPAALVVIVMLAPGEIGRDTLCQRAQGGSR